MTNVIYGVDTDLKLTPTEVREAMKNCFIQAHGEILDQLLEFGKDEIDKEASNRLKELNIEFLLRDFFKKAGGDYENPNKKSLLEVANKLKNFSQSFRAEDIINKHYSEITKLINLLD